MAEIDHFTYGPVTPGLAYALSVLGALLGLTFTANARTAATPGRRAWYLLLAAWAIGGTGIWVMHFMAMLGFGVEGAEIRYDVPITTASAVIAVSVVAIGLFTAGLGRVHPVKIMLGGMFTGLGVAAMHYTGMYAMQLDGEVFYDDRLVAASIGIAVVAATVALWFTVTVRKPLAIVGSALVMGVAVCGMHYTGMYAMEVHVHDTGTVPAGSTSYGLLLPIVLLVIFVVVALIYAVVSAPTAEDLAADAYLASRRVEWQQAAASAADPVGLASRVRPRPAAASPGPAPPGPAPPGPVQPGPAAAGPAAPGPAAAGPAAPGPAEPGPAEPGQAEPGQAKANGRRFPTSRRQSIPRAPVTRRRP